MGPAPGDIPALDEPPMVAADQAGPLSDEDEVIGLAGDETGQCYPLSILRWHCVVNGSLGDQPVLVLFDPLSGACLAFSRQVGDEALSFAVSGKAAKGAGLLYDRGTLSLWAPLTGECVAGQWAGRGRLTPLPARRTTWGEWRRAYPAGLVLSRNTGFGRAYDVDPYAAAPLGFGGKRVNYWADPNLVLAPPTGKLPEVGHAPKTLVLGVEVGRRCVAFAPPEGPAAPLCSETTVAGQQLAVTWDPRVGSRAFEAVEAPSGQSPPQLTCYWFAWQAAHPDTALVSLGG